MSGYPQGYYVATAGALPGLSLLDGDRTVDVCVVGGGYTGLGAALHLVRSGRSVALLEAERLGWGASGRNGGQVHLGMRRDQLWLEGRYGAVTARRLWNIAKAAREHLDWAIATYGIDCDFTPGHLHLDHKERYVAHSRAHVEHMARHYGRTDLEFVERSRVRELVASDGYYGGVIDPQGGHLHALDWALGLARAARNEGAALFDGSRVTAITPAGTRWHVVTPLGTVTADRVIVATNGYLQGLLPQVEAHVMPINNYIAVTEPLGAERATELIASNLAVSDSRYVVYYFRMTRDHRLLFGGGETYSLRFPDDISAFVRPHITRVFPQLHDVPIDYAWGGTLAITPNRMPYVREVRPGLFNVSGFCGLGVVLGPWLGKIAADAAAGRRADFDLLSAMHVPAFPGGKNLRAPILVTAMSGAAILDRL